MSIKAYATVRLTGCNIRRFINLCTANHIKIWNLKYVSPKEYEACSGDLYYKRAELITSVITEKYSLLEESFLDHMVEEIYSKIYSDIVEE